MLKRFEVRGTYTMLITASDANNARKLAIFNAEKLGVMDMDNDLSGRAWINLSDPESVEFFRCLTSKGN